MAKVHTPVGDLEMCLDDSCDGSHCSVCGGHFADFYGDHLLCTYCSGLNEEQAEQVQQANYRAWEERYPGVSDMNWLEMVEPTQLPHS